MTSFDPGLHLDAIGSRLEVEWFTTAPQNERFVALPADVHLRAEDGSVTWGWRIEPIPVDPAGRRFRRFRHPDGWVMLTDADDPETIFLVSEAELHTVTGVTTQAWAVAAGTVPGSGDAYAVQKAAESGGRYRLDHATEIEAVGAALALWCEIFLDRHVTLVGRSPAQEESAAMSESAADDAFGVAESSPLGADQDVIELLEGLDDVFWFQADLTWPDRDDAEAFRDRIDVRLRDTTGVDTWLVSVEPLDGARGGRRRLEDGGVAVLDPDDPGVIRLAWDRMVLAVSVPETGFEPAGVAVPLGTAPGTDQWEELRRVGGEHEGSVVIHAPAWSEGRVAAGLAEWAAAWAGLRPRFVYDFDDPVSQEAIEANNLLEHAAPAARSIRTSTRQTCHHTDEATSTYEEPLPCGRPATAYYRHGADMVLVCDDHAPSGVRLTTLLRA